MSQYKNGKYKTILNSEIKWRVTYRFQRATSIFPKSLPFTPSHFSQKSETFVIRMDRPREKNNTAQLEWTSLATVSSK